ncbi:MAG TPA: outer membrane protein assembly factor BamD [Myxococcaceae bacterium]|nr:outer membrane protein assembly factor BamD [Myxococcaceae bacterium]
MRRLVPLLLSACLPACATGSGEGPEPTYSSDAAVNMKRGNEALAAKQYVAAEKYFEYVKSKFPFLDASREAELRLADVSFEREYWTEARDRYVVFVKLHPTYFRVDYAAYRAALTYYKDMPSDFFILPPGSERDQTQVKGAYDSLASFVKTYPDSTYVADAKKYAEDARQRLIQHELYVANFYEKRGHLAGAAGRLEMVVTKYPGMDEASILFHLHDLYLKLSDPVRAKGALERIVTRYPGTPDAKRAQAMLGG